MATKPHFKSWVPEWLIRVAIFMLLLPNLLLIVIAKTSESAACGFYGINPNDAEYSIIVLFCSIVAFFPMQIRFANFFITKDYLLISVILEVLTTFLCYSTRNLELLLIFRFLEGIANCFLATNCIALIFSRLTDERARVIGFSVFFGMVLCLVPFVTFASAPIIDTYDYNVLYKIMIYSFIPGCLAFMIIMKRERTNDRVSLHGLDWSSYTIYAAIMLLAAYVLIYGQQLNWFSNPRILWATIVLMLLIVTFIFRQLTLKVPYVNLTVFAYPRFVLVFMLVVIFYTARGTFNYLVVYLAVVLGLDPIHIGYLFLYNIAGIIIGVIISSRLLILKKSMRLILLSGFTLQFIFFCWMTFLFVTEGNTYVFIIPFITFGLGTGMLLTPIVVALITSVPKELAFSATGLGVGFRLLGVCVSFAFINYFQLYASQNHFNRFQDQLNANNPLIEQRLNDYRGLLSQSGVNKETANHLSGFLLNNAVTRQVEQRVSMDFFELNGLIVFIVILLLLIRPRIGFNKFEFHSVHPI